MYVGLTTCPEHASGNVGDKLITEASIQLIEDIHGPIDINVHFRREEFTSRLDYLNNSEGILCFGFPFRESSTRPKIYRIAENLDEVQVPIIPIGATHSFYPGDCMELKNRDLKRSTTSFLDRIVQDCPKGEIPVRTEWVGEVLRQHGYDTVLTGDPAWYDPDFIGEEFHKPNKIDQLVFTPPHSSHYLSQAKKVLKRLTRQYSGATRIMVLHSAPTDVDRELSETAHTLGWQLHYASHDGDKLNLYHDSDLHVGYRKHGHLAHLRWRRPSIVLAEDSRAQGLNETFGTAGFPAFDSRKGISRFLGDRVYNSLITQGMYRALNNLEKDRLLPPKKNLVAPPNSNAVNRVFEFISQQEANGWRKYDDIQKIIDQTYENKMYPYLRNAIKPVN